MGADAVNRGGRGGWIGAVERAWSGAPGTVPWTLALAPAAALYAAASGATRHRAASEIRNDFASGWKRHVGWNCMNSRFATGAPARNAAASPSPVAMSGFVV